MVLVSIHPFAFRKIFLVLAVLLGFSALCFADPVLMAHRYSDQANQSKRAQTAAPTLEVLEGTRAFPATDLPSVDFANSPADVPAFIAGDFGHFKLDRPCERRPAPCGPSLAWAAPPTSI
jgi:hypothetical protein